ncbi:MAG: hypothetical protein C5B47_00015 [Verrucomicrobia bacterium]|nr:MAG: hypothetical protein C5B47_00015 [Verrucomicrobiota bacterium]
MALRHFEWVDGRGYGWQLIRDAIHSPPLEGLRCGSQLPAFQEDVRAFLRNRQLLGCDWQFENWDARFLFVPTHLSGEPKK